MKQDKVYRGHLSKYVKENLSKGYFLIPLFLVLIILMSVFFFIKPAIVGYIVITKEFNFTDNIGLTFNESANYVWNLENKGILKSIKLNGEVKINGTVKVYLEHENKKYLIFDNKKLEEKGFGGITGFIVNVDKIEVQTKGNLTAEIQSILDDLISDINKTKNNVKMEVKAGNNETNIRVDGDITNEQELLINILMDILNSSKENIKIKIKSKFKEIGAQEELINDTLKNETLIVNESKINETEVKDTVSINETIIKNITIIPNESIINETSITIPSNETINLTGPINKTIENISVNKININLEYKGDSIYDINNKGIENIDSVIDLTVENTEFNWEIKEENLCTRWDIYSVENKESTIVCYGSSRCCNFIGLPSARSEWDEPFYSAYGQYDATLNNVISAQVLYVDYNLSLEGPYAEIYYSDWKNLTVQFYQGFVSFENICVETCILPNLNASSYRLIIEINNSGIILGSISYIVTGNETINSPPVLLNNFTDISILEDESYIINLNEYFYDEDNDTLMFTSYNNSNMNALIINETAILKPVNFTGKTYMFFTASDSVDEIVSNVFEIEVKEHKINTTGLKSLRQLIGYI
jgi:hypothetical protein